MLFTKVRREDVVTEPLVALYGHEKTSSEVEAYMVVPSSESARPWLSFKVTKSAPNYMNKRTFH